jgi:hypothetical protein
LGRRDQVRRLEADVTASADATMKLRGEVSGTSADLPASFDPFISTFQFKDKGLLLQASWGGAAFVP